MIHVKHFFSGLGNPAFLEKYEYSFIGLRSKISHLTLHSLIFTLHSSGSFDDALHELFEKKSAQKTPSEKTWIVYVVQQRKSTVWCS